MWSGIREVSGESEEGGLREYDPPWLIDRCYFRSGFKEGLRRVCGQLVVLGFSAHGPRCAINGPMRVAKIA